MGSDNKSLEDGIYVLKTTKPDEDGQGRTHKFTQ